MKRLRAPPSLQSSSSPPLREQLLTFDARAALWPWNMARIQVKGFTDNVVDLMVGKLNRLPDGSREVLKQVACLGYRAAIATLTLVRGGCGEGDARRPLGGRARRACPPRGRRLRVRSRLRPRGGLLAHPLTARSVANLRAQVSN
jgi:hypothetical protein